MPDWKRALVQKKLDEKAVRDEEEQEKHRDVNEKLESIRAMPDWKRKIYLEKNPQYKELLGQ